LQVDHYNLGSSSGKLFAECAANTASTARDYHNLIGKLQNPS